MFRKLLGDAMMMRTPVVGIETWGHKDRASREVRDMERSLERAVSRRIGEMSVVALPVEDEPGPRSLRGFIERNAIALLSGYVDACIDPPSRDWLGFYSTRERVRRSGLWNSNHVEETPDPAFHATLRDLVAEAPKIPRGSRLHGHSPCSRD
ncbi:MAG: hypothetical protein OXQ86_08780 [Gammaproteobacteria bacterium]|nr:hypothetical protein [Gammaproteobacteria bacterium]MDE0414046.1 hypothetical protein [Gammaproteobacteria bacterium]